MAKAKKETSAYQVIENYFDSQLKREMVVGDVIEIDVERAKKLMSLNLVKSTARA